MNKHLSVCRIVLLVWLLFLQSMTGYAQLEIKVRDVKCHGGSDGAIEILTGFQAVFEWLDGHYSAGTSAYRDLLEAGTYTVVISLRDGGDGKVENCSEARSIEVKQPSQLKLNIKSIPVPGPHKCWRKVPVTLEVSASGGTPPYTIGNVQTNVIQKFAPSSGVYKFNVLDDNHCYAKIEKHVMIGAKWCSQDPNDILGPSGYDNPNWVSKFDTLPYTIRFENDPLLATAPAQHIFITHDFDEGINPYSFRLRDFGFGDHHFSVPDNSPSFQKRYDLTEELDIYLDVVAGLNVQTNQAFWSLTAIDPLTGQRPVNPLIGFLPVNDTITSSGEGFVSFSVKPKANTMTGDTVHALAEIVFDENEPIRTNTWTNVIDALPPATALNPLQPITEDGQISLTWTGSDDPNGSGLGEIRMYVSIDSSDFIFSDVINLDSSSYLFRGEYGRHYQFKLIGIDNTGNTELKQGIDGAVFILPRKEIIITSVDDIDFCAKETLDIEWTTIMVDTVHLYMQINQSGSLIQLAQGLTMDASPFSWSIPDSLSDMHVQLFVVMADSVAIRDSSGIFYVHRLPNVIVDDDIHTCVGAIHHLAATGANHFDWQPSSIYHAPGESVLSFIADTSIQYHVTGTDAVGCTNTDSILITVHSDYLDTLLIEICNQDSVFAGGEYQNAPGFYIDELASSFGCDSTVVTELVLNGPCIFPSPQVYVDEDATGLNNGTSWENAFIELRDALKVAGEWAGANVIWVAEGTYSPHPTRRDTSFILHDSIKIYGGFLGFETTLSERTVNPELVKISGDINLADTLWDNSYHTVVFSSACQQCSIDGATIRYGQADALINAFKIGAGVLNEGVGHFYNVVFERNYATDLGAALYSSGAAANLIIENCIFRLNTSNLGRDVVNLNGAQVEFRGLNSIH